MRDFANLQGASWPLRVTVQAGVALLFGALLAFLAPFGTYRLSAAERVGYWTGQMVAWLLLSLLTGWAVAHLPATRRRRVVEQRLAVILLAAVPMMVFTGLSNRMLQGWHADAADVAELFFSILLIGGGHVLLSDRLLANIAQNPAVPAPTGAVADALPGLEEVTETPPETGLLDRLPVHLRDDIQCLQMEDHYVRVHGRHDNAMVLMRFSDAMRGVQHLAGSQVHRSWWVADHAVVDLRRSGRTAQLVLHNGLMVPVSQPYLAHVAQRWGLAGGIQRAG